MSDDDLDALFDQIDDDDIALCLQNAEETLNSSVKEDKHQDKSQCDATPALNVSQNEENLRLELEEMKRKMKMMEEMLEKQRMESPPKVAQKPAQISKPNNSNRSPPSNVKSEVTPNKPSLSDKFKGVLGSGPTANMQPSQNTNKTPSQPSQNTNKTPSQPSQNTSKTPSKTKLSDSFSSALDESLSKSKAVKQSNIKQVKSPVQPEKLDKCPHSGIRISNRVIAKSDFNCAVATRKFIKINHLPLHFKDKQDLPGDWVTSGVIVRKAGPYKASTGNDYSIWTLSDLVSADNIMSLFLFKDVHLAHRKEQVGTVVALLNPSFMPPRDQEKGKKSDLAFTLDNPQKLLRMGMAADYSTCRNLTKSGQACNNFINKALTQYCDFHIVKVHAKLRNQRMVLNGSYTPQPGTSKVQKLKQDCQAFIHKGNVYYPNVKPSKSESTAGDKPEVAALKKKGMVISSPLLSSDEFKSRLKVQSAGSVQLKRALETTAKSTGTAQNSKRAKLDSMGSCKTFFKKHVEAPKLGVGAGAGGFINLNTSGKKAAVKAKALSLAKKGAFAPTNAARKRHQLTPEERMKMKERSLGLEKEQPAQKEIVLNGPSDMLYHKPIQARKTTINPAQNKENKMAQRNSKSKEKDAEPVKKKGILSAAFGTIDTDSIEGKRIMKAQSVNAGAIREQEIERTTDYFNAMEKFENNEEKLMSIKEMKVTVYICNICNTATSKQQPKCIEEKHPVKKGPAVRKFFKCAQCSQRTDIVGLPYPDHACSKCGKSAWAKCSMYHEKKGPKLESERLVVRAEDVEVQDKFR